MLLILVLVGLFFFSLAAFTAAAYAPRVRPRIGGMWLAALGHDSQGNLHSNAVEAAEYKGGGGNGGGGGLGGGVYGARGSNGVLGWINSLWVEIFACGVGPE